MWGAAYRLPPPGRARGVALAYLEEREKQYDVRLRADLHASADPGADADADEPVVRRALLCVPPPTREHVHACSAQSALLLRARVALHQH